MGRPYTTGDPAMKKKAILFKGAYTAIVTPFDKHDKVDYKALKNLIERQIRSGINGIVPVGTTGESPTLDMDEHCKVVDFAVETAAGRVTVIAGTGANSTDEAVELTRAAIKSGADATLQVTPYYNKPNAEGLYRHFATIADLGIPTILYNVPSRTGKEIPVDTVVRLSKHPNIPCIKEAGGSVDRASIILRSCNITVLSGDDSLTLPMLAVGAKGVISVASNIIPKEIARMVQFALAGKWEEARKTHLKYHKLFSDLFMDTNPIPIKTAMKMMGLAEDLFRLPLCQMNKDMTVRLKKTLADYGLLTRKS